MIWIIFISRVTQEDFNPSVYSFNFTTSIIILSFRRLKRLSEIVKIAANR